MNPKFINISSELAGENQSQKTPSLVKIPIGNSSHLILNENVSPNFTRPGIYKKGACTPRTELLTVIKEDPVIEGKLDGENQFQENPKTSYETPTSNINRLDGENQSQKTPTVVNIPIGNSSASETNNENVLKEKKRKRKYKSKRKIIYFKRRADYKVYWRI